MDRKRIEPGRGQVSVWDYPRPPKLEDLIGPFKGAPGTWGW